ncbi:hypothetical protein H4J02_03490 [Protaetiibacter sp. SSC-01]|uniref:hypothetical protein n=1 Tax=Protaetiibacter sp. SSC-01 TaxID=2759943 RepID=UPI00165692DE|nr:hypothetical protein [Protaetiibacter sp. SSC-01]QNO38105.1 hypothetical protein H4J02_03490 [Protaetiibacter sp. SSC-01]
MRRTLHARVRLVVDSGSVEGGSFRGRRRVAQQLIAQVSGGGRVPAPARINGTSGVRVVAPDGTVVALLAVGSARAPILELWMWTAPEKLRRWPPPRSAPSDSPFL